MPPRQQNRHNNNHSTPRNFVPSSSKVHKTCSSPSILRMMEESGDCEGDEHRKSLILDDEFSRKSLVFEDEPSRKSSVLDDEPSRKSLVLDDETLGRSLVPDDESQKSKDESSLAKDSGLTRGAVAVTYPVINADSNSESGFSPDIALSRSPHYNATAVETPNLNFSSQKVNSPAEFSLKKEEEEDGDDDKDNKVEDVFATPLVTPFGTADNNAPDVAAEGEGPSGGFTSILKSFWKRTSFVWDDQEEEEHCGDKEEEDGEGGAEAAEDAAGSESKQTEVVEIDLREIGEDVGYKRRVQKEVTEASSNVPLGGEPFSEECVHLADPSKNSETATVVVNNDGGIPGE